MRHNNAIHDHTPLTTLNTRYQTGFNREHSYRADLQNLLKAILPPDILITNEPARIACGAPDYILTRIQIPIGYIEAKAIGVDLNSKTPQRVVNFIVREINCCIRFKRG